MSNRLHTTIGWILGIGAAVFVLLLAGMFSGTLTEDPPAVSPYASSGDITTTTAASTTTAGTDEPIAADAASLTISGFAFGDPITVPIGTEVTITNEDGAAHTWTSRDGLWDSGSLGGGDTFSFTFGDDGEFGFFCAFHGSMTGTITVTG